MRSDYGKTRINSCNDIGSNNYNNIRIIRCNNMEFYSDKFRIISCNDMGSDNYGKVTIISGNDMG